MGKTRYSGKSLSAVIFSASASKSKLSPCMPLTPLLTCISLVTELDDLENHKLHKIICIDGLLSCLLKLSLLRFEVDLKY